MNDGTKILSVRMSALGGTSGFDHTLFIALQLSIVKKRDENTGRLRLITLCETETGDSHVLANIGEGDSLEETTKSIASNIAGFGPALKATTCYRIEAATRYARTGTEADDVLHLLDLQLSALKNTPLHLSVAQPAMESVVRSPRKHPPFSTGSSRLDAPACFTWVRLPRAPQPGASEFAQVIRSDALTGVITVELRAHDGALLEEIGVRLSDVQPCMEPTFKPPFNGKGIGKDIVPYPDDLVESDY